MLKLCEWLINYTNFIIITYIAVVLIITNISRSRKTGDVFMSSVLSAMSVLNLLHGPVIAYITQSA